MNTPGLAAALGAVPALGAADRPSYETVGPGFAGFVAIFVLALATVALIRSMTGHLRKVRYGAGPDVPPAPGPDVPREPPAAPPETPGGPPASRR